MAPRFPVVGFCGHCGEPLKVCKRCGLILPGDAFGRHALALDGAQSWCKRCHLADKRARVARLAARREAAARARAALRAKRERSATVDGS